jgi:hypothetical protein
MNSREEALAAEREALHHIAEHPERVSRREDQISRYLAGIALAETRRVHPDRPARSTQAPAKNP